MTSRRTEPLIPMARSPLTIYSPRVRSLLGLRSLVPRIGDKIRIKSFPNRVYLIVPNYLGLTCEAGHMMLHCFTSVDPASCIVVHPATPIQT